MTPEMERIGKIFVEAEGGCWHEPKKYHHTWSAPYWAYECSKCKVTDYHGNSIDNPDFSNWENFGRLLKIAEKHEVLIIFNCDGAYHYLQIGLKIDFKNMPIDQIPALVATELAKILEEK